MLQANNILLDLAERVTHDAVGLDQQERLAKPRQVSNYCAVS